MYIGYSPCQLQFLFYWRFLFVLKVKTNKRYAGSSKWTVKVSCNMPLNLIPVIWWRLCRNNTSYRRSNSYICLHLIGSCWDCEGWFWQHWHPCSFSCQWSWGEASLMNRCRHTRVPSLLISIITTIGSSYFCLVNLICFYFQGNKAFAGDIKKWLSCCSFSI
jgi:hypothetical protein